MEFEEPIGMNIILTKLIEVPENFTLQEKIALLNLELTEMQEAGYIVLSSKPYTDSSFIIEYRKGR